MTPHLSTETQNPAAPSDRRKQPGSPITKAFVLLAMALILTLLFLPFSKTRSLAENLGSAQTQLRITYVSADRLEDEYAYRIKRNWDGKGSIFIGRIEPPAGGKISRRAIIEDDNSFASAVYPGRVMTFLSHGYDPLQVTGGAQVWGPIYDVGTVRFQKTPAEKLRTLTGVLSTPDAKDDDETLLTAELVIPNNITVSSDDGWWQTRTRPVVEKQTLRPGQPFLFTGLSPIPYELDIKGDGYARQTIKIDPKAAGKIELGEINLHKSPKLRFQYLAQIDPENSQSWGKPKSVEIVCDNKNEFMFTRTRDELRNTLPLELRVTGVEVTPHFSWGDSEYFLLGPGKLEDYLARDDWKASIKGPGCSEGIPLKSGHVYFFRNKWKKVSCLFGVEEVTP